MEAHEGRSGGHGHRAAEDGGRSGFALANPDRLRCRLCRSKIQEQAEHEANFSYLHTLPSGTRPFHLSYSSDRPAVIPASRLTIITVSGSAAFFVEVTVDGADSTS
jgi:hypothetical protein